MSSRASISVHALQVVHVDAGLVVGEVGPVYINIWRGEVTEKRFLIQRDALIDLVSRYRPNAAFLCIVEEGAPPPSPELRRASVDMLSKLDKQLCSAVVVVEGTGFMAAVARSVLIGMSALLGQRSFPVTYVASVDEAACQLPHQLAMVPKTLVRDVAELRAAMDAESNIRRKT